MGLNKETMTAWLRVFLDRNLAESNILKPTCYSCICSDEFELTTGQLCVGGNKPRPWNNLPGVPAGNEGGDSAGSIQSQGLQQPIQTAELAVDDLPATEHKDMNFNNYLKFVSL